MHIWCYDFGPFGDNGAFRRCCGEQVPESVYHGADGWRNFNRLQRTLAALVRRTVLGRMSVGAFRKQDTLRIANDSRKHIKD